MERGYAGYIYARAGQREKAEEMVSASRLPNERALIFAGLGNKDETIKALEGMADRGATRLGHMLGFPEMDLVKGDPRVAALRQKVGLPQ